MRVLLQVVAILERAGLAFVAVDREQPRRRLGAHQRPLAAGRKAGAAEAAQSGVAHDLDQVVAGALAGQAIAQQRVAAVLAVAREIVRRRKRMRMRRRLRGGCDRVRRRVEHLHMPDRTDRRAVARAHAWRAHDAHLAPEFSGKIAQQMLRAAHGAGERVAHPHRHRRRRGLAFLHHVEMRVEGRDLVDLGERKLHLGGERGEMRGREMPVAVLDEMQILDQEIAPQLARTEQRADVIERSRIDLAALGGPARAAAAVAVRSGAVWLAAVYLGI